MTSISASVLKPGDLVLCSGTLPRDVSLFERVAAASEAGFAGISLWGRDYQAARDEGLSDREIRSLLSDHGITVAEIDPLWCWLPGARDIHIPPEFDTEDIFAFDEARLFDVAQAVGARSVNAVDIFGGGWTTDEATEAFASLCRRAAEHGLLVHVEFLPWSNIPDLETAWRIVRDAGEPNGGIALDAWHYFRSAPDDALLRSIPGGRILCVQLSDGPAEPEADLVSATLSARLLPGEGELDLLTMIDSLRHIGAAAPIGVEVFSDSLRDGTSVEVAHDASEAVRRVLRS
jgi:sugar phosphate isomerase/epimerase